MVRVSSSQTPTGRTANLEMRLATREPSSAVERIESAKPAVVGNFDNQDFFRVGFGVPIQQTTLAMTAEGCEVFTTFDVFCESRQSSAA